jgi:RHS repeat-associated protein
MDIHYVHDALGRRIGKLRDGNLEKGWLYADALNPIAQLDSSGNVEATFIYGTRAHVPDAMVMTDGTVYRFITDHLGSVRLVVNAATGVVAQRMDYDAFGRVLNAVNRGFQPFGFAGGLYDDDTGLVRFGARDYDAYAGRWTAKDPTGFAGRDPNLYAYASSDPANQIDPDGMIVPVFVGGLLGGAVVGGLVGGVLGGVKAAAAGGDFSSIASSVLTGAGIGAVAGALSGLTVVLPAAATVAIVGEGAVGGGAQFALGFAVAVRNPKWPGVAATVATTLFKDLVDPQKASGQSLDAESAPCK